MDRPGDRQLWETLAILAALKHRDATGEGCFIDLSMLEATVALLPDAVLHSAIGADTLERGSESEIGASPSGCFKCKGDDSWIAVSVRDDQEWQRFCRAIARDDLASDPSLQHRSDRIARRYELNRIVADWCSVRLADDVETGLQAERVPAARSRGIRELLTDRHLQQRQVFRQIEDGSWTIALPWTDDAGWRGELTAMPSLGADNDYVFGELLGLSPERQSELRSKGVIA